MKKILKSISFLLMFLLVLSCSKDEVLLPAGDDPSYELKGAKVIATPLEFSGDSYYEGYVPKTGLELFGGTLPCVATLISKGGQSYDLILTEIFVPAVVERHVTFPLKISPGGVVKGYWPETWYDFGNPPEIEEPNTNVVGQISGHVGCDLHGPGINKGTIICTGTYDGAGLEIVFRFNGVDNGETSTMTPPEGPPAVWDQIDGPAKFEFSYILEVD